MHCFGQNGAVHHGSLALSSLLSFLFSLFALPFSLSLFALHLSLSSPFLLLRFSLLSFLLSVSFVSLSLLSVSLSSLPFSTCPLSLPPLSLCFSFSSLCLSFLPFLFSVSLPSLLCAWCVRPRSFCLSARPLVLLPRLCLSKHRFRRSGAAHCGRMAYRAMLCTRGNVMKGYATEQCIVLLEMDLKIMQEWATGGFCSG